MDFFTKLDFAGVASFITIIFFILKSLRTQHSDDVSQDATTAKEYAEAATRAIEYADKMANRVGIMEKEQEQDREDRKRLRKEMDEVCSERLEYLKILVKWAHGLFILQSQFRAVEMTAAWMPDREELEKFKNLNIKEP